MIKNRFYQAKKSLFKYAILPTLAIISSCALNKEFADDDLYYSPKDDVPKIETVYLNTLEKEVEADTLEIEDIWDLNYAVRSGADASLYWENYFIYSPYRSSLGWDSDGDGMVNAFDPQPYIYNFLGDANNNGIWDELEFSPYFSTNLSFIYWDLQWNYHRGYSYWGSPWNNHYGNYYSYRYPWHHDHTHIYYFDYDNDLIKPNYGRRQRTLTTRVKTQSRNQENTGGRRSNEINPRNQENTSTRTRPINTTTRSKYERPTSTRERPNTNYSPRNKPTTRETRNTYYPKTQKTRSTYTNSNRSRSTTTRSSTVRSSSGSSGSSRSSGSSGSSGSSSRSSGSSSSKRGGRR